MITFGVGGSGAGPNGFSVVSNSSVVAVTPTSSTLIASNGWRKYLHIVNNSTFDIWIQYGSAAQVGRGIRITPNTLLVMSGSELFKGQINAISAVATSIDILEGE